MRAGQLSQASRSARASLNTWATACERSTSSPFNRARRTLLVCALTTSLTVRACSTDVPPEDSAGVGGFDVSRCGRVGLRARGSCYGGLRHLAGRCRNLRGRFVAGQVCYRPPGRRGVGRPLGIGHHRIDGAVRQLADASGIDGLLDGHVRHASLARVGANGQSHGVDLLSASGWPPGGMGQAKASESPGIRKSLASVAHSA